MAGDSYPDHLQVLRYPDPRLRRVAEPVVDFGAELGRLCAAMRRQMTDHRGIGLAATQLGIDRRLFVTNRLAGEEDEDEFCSWINPRLENPQGRAVFEEGCLSVPEIYAKVNRNDEVDVIYQDETGTEHRRHLCYSAGDVLAIVVQHELDHLDGVLFIDHLSSIQLTVHRRHLKALERAYQAATGRSGTVLRR